MASPQPVGLPGREQQLEGERRVEVFEVGLPLRARQVDLAHQVGVTHRLAHLGQRCTGVGGVARVGQRELGLVLAERQAVRLRGRRIVAQLRVLEQPVDRVHPIAGDTAVEPEAQRVLHGRHDLRVAPVEIGLLGIEGVEVVAPVQRLPGRAAEGRGPVVGPVGPDVPIRMFAEPWVLDGRMARHDVHEHLEVARMSGADERVEVIQRPEHGIDPGVVGHVVSEVGHRRRVDGREPEDVHAQPGQVIEARLDARKVPDAVPVVVLKGARIDLVDDGVRSHRESQARGRERVSLGIKEAGMDERRFRVERKWPADWRRPWLCGRVVPGSAAAADVPVSATSRQHLLTRRPSTSGGRHGHLDRRRRRNAQRRSSTAGLSVTLQRPSTRHGPARGTFHDPGTFRYFCEPCTHIDGRLRRTSRQPPRPPARPHPPEPLRRPAAAPARPVAIRARPAASPARANRS